MKIGTNYKGVISKAEEFPQFKQEVEEIKDMIINGYNVKNNILELKDKVEKIINQPNSIKINSYLAKL